MEISPDQLEQELQRKLEPLYYVAGEETLLVNESREAIVAAAKNRDYTESARMDIGESTWQDVLVELNSRSLFAERRIIQIRLAKNGMAGAATKTISKYLENPSPENVVVVSSRSFDSRHRRTKWYKLIKEKAATVICGRLAQQPYFKWIQSRAKSVGLNLSAEAVDSLATSCEGNLVAAAQELEKLSLIFSRRDDVIDTAMIDVQDVSTGTAYELIRNALIGNVDRTMQLLRVLERQGESPLGLIYFLASQLRRAQPSTSRGGYSPQDIQRVQRRHGTKGIHKLLASCALIDGQIKGLYRSEDWAAVTQVFLAVAGAVQVKSTEFSDINRIDYENK